MVLIPLTIHHVPACMARRESHDKANDWEMTAKSFPSLGGPLHAISWLGEAVNNEPAILAFTD